MLVPNSPEDVSSDKLQISPQGIGNMNNKRIMDDQELHAGERSTVQAWQCFDGSISSVDSLSEPLPQTSMFHKSLLLSDDDQDGSPCIGASDQSADEAILIQRAEDTGSRVKLMCSFGGRILPRPSDGKLRYVGGDTRIVSVDRSITYRDLMAKMKQHYGEDLALKYQLPNEDLDSLISVSNDEDLQNMMEEYDRLEAGDGLQRLRVILFSTLEDVSVDSLGDPKRSEQWYVEAVNGFLENSSRRSDGGFSGGRLSARPSADNLISLDGFDSSHGHMEEVPVMKKHAVFSGNSSPSLLPQRHTHAFAMLNPEQFALYNPDVTQNELEHYFGNPRQEMLSHEHERIPGRGYNVEGMLPRVGSHGKLSRLQDHEEHEMLLRGYAAENMLPHVKLPPRFLEHDEHEPFFRGMNRAGSHGKISRLQDDPQQSQEFMMEQQRQRFMHQQHQQQQQTQYLRQQHSDPMIHHVGSLGKIPRLDQHDDPQELLMDNPRQKFGQYIPRQQQQHPLDDYRRQEYDGGYVQAPPPLHYHEPIYRPDHHQHRHPDDNYMDDLRHCGEDYYPGHLYHGNGMSPHPPYQNPSSPRLAYRQPYNIHRGYEPPRYRDDYSSPHGIPQYYQQDGNQRNSRLEMENLSLNGNQRYTGGDKEDQQNMKEVLGHGKSKMPDEKCEQHFDTRKSAEAPRFVSEAGKLAEQMVSSVLKSTVEQDVPVEQWENHDEDTQKEDDDTQKISENGSSNVILVAEKEAISRDLQIIKNSDLEEIRELGSGTYGTVFHGKWRGTDVAIKRIKASCFNGKPSERDRLVADFWREACTLSQLKHPNVVAFYGVVPDGPDGTLATVTEYMVNGSLKQVLQKKDRTVDRRKRLIIAMEAAFGMEYLHEKKIVHFDLKCENLLVNMRDPHRPICKVGDLGLSKVKRQTMVSGGVRGTLPWMAPELLTSQNDKVSEKVDVYSFGIVMWELLTGEEPYANKHHGAIIAGIVKNELRPEIPKWCDPAWRSLMEKCWAADPTARPTFSEIASDLRAMTSSLQQKS